MVVFICIMELNTTILYHFIDITDVKDITDLTT